MRKGPSHTVKVTGISDELLSLIDKNIRRVHAKGRSEYIRELIRKDLLACEKGKPFYEAASREEWSDVFRRWAESHHRDFSPLTDKATRRESIYGDRGA